MEGPQGLFRYFDSGEETPPHIHSIIFTMGNISPYQQREKVNKSQAEIAEEVRESASKTKECVRQTGLNGKGLTRKYLMFAMFAMIFVSMVGMASAIPIVTPTTFSSNQSVMKFYNITVNNSEPASSNISEVNITLPAGFLYHATSAGNALTGAGTSFSNSTLASGATVLRWNQSVTGIVVQNVTNSSFWFNATANLTTVGVFHFNVSLLNSTGPQYYDIVVTINDTVAPTVTVTSPVAQTYTGTSNFTISLIASATDNSGSIVGPLWYTMNGGVTNTTFTSPTFITATQGSNTITVYANDSSALVGSSTVTFTLPGISIVGANAACSSFAQGVGNLGYGILTLLGIVGVIIVFAAVVLLVMAVQGNEVMGLGAMEIAIGAVSGLAILVLMIIITLVAMQAICPGV